MGGYHRLSGYEQNQFVSNYLALTGVSYRYISPWKMLNKPLILGTSLEISNCQEKTDDISSKGLKMSASLFGAINTPIGPGTTGLGHYPQRQCQPLFLSGQNLLRLVNIMNTSAQKTPRSLSHNCNRLGKPITRCCALALTPA